MLYINAYIVHQAYGGPEEGGWYFDCGVREASVPIATEYQLGKECFFATGELVIQDCRYCDDDESTEGCDNCGEIPKNTVDAENKIAELRLILEHDLHMGEREKLVIMLENHQAANYPEKRSHYE